MTNSDKARYTMEDGKMGKHVQWPQFRGKAKGHGLLEIIIIALAGFRQCQMAGFV